MTAFSSADLPSTINTVEKLAVWAALVLNHVNPTLTVVEMTGSAERAATSGPFYIVAGSEPGWRQISRQSIKLNANWQRGVGKLWTHAEDLSNAAIPTEFKS